MTEPDILESDDRKPLALMPSLMVSVSLQHLCAQHRYIRGKPVDIYERPERLTAVSVGIAAAAARLGLALEEEAARLRQAAVVPKEDSPEDLALVLEKMTLAAQSAPIQESTLGTVFDVKHSMASIDLLTDPAVAFVHADPDLSPNKQYLYQLKDWCHASAEKTRAGKSEIPEALPQGDLYRMSAKTTAQAAFSQNSTNLLQSVPVVGMPYPEP
jgi:histone deacetylase HOS3